MNDARTSSSADCHRLARQVSFGDSGKNSIFFVTDVDELDPAVSAKSIYKGIESISDNAITAFDAGVRKHLTQDICDFPGHNDLLSRDNFPLLVIARQIQPLLRRTWLHEGAEPGNGLAENQVLHLVRALVGVEG